MTTKGWEKVVFERKKKGIPHPDHVRREPSPPPMEQKAMSPVPETIDVAEVENLKRQAVRQLHKAAEENATLRKENEDLRGRLVSGAAEQAKSLQQKLDESHAQVTQLQKMLEDKRFTLPPDSTLSVKEQAWKEQMKLLQSKKEEQTDKIRVLVEENQKLKDDLDVKQSTTVELTMEVERYSRLASKGQSSQHELLQRQLAAEQQRDSLSLEVETLNERLIDADKSHKDLLSKLQRYEREKEQLDTKLAQALSSGDMHRLNADEVARTLEQLRMNSDHQQQRYDKLSKMLEDTNAMLAEARNARQTAENQLDNSLLDLQNVQRDREKLKKEVEHLNDHCRSVNSQLSQLQQDHTQLECQMSEASAERDLLHADVSQLKQAQLEIQRLTSQVDELRRQLAEERENYNRRVSQERAQTDAELEEGRAERSKLHNDYRSVQQEKRQLQVQVDDLTGDKQRQQDELRASMQKITSLEAKREALQLDVSSMREKIHECEVTNREQSNKLQRLDREKEELDTKLNNALQLGDSHRLTADELHRNVEEMRINSEHRQQRCDKLTKMLEDTNNNLEEIRISRRETEDKLAAAELELQAAVRDKEKSAKEIDTLNNHVSSLTQHIASVQGEKRSLEMQLDDSLNERQKLQDELHSVQHQLTHHTKQMTVQITEVYGEKESAEQALQLAQQQHDKVRDELQTEKNKYLEEMKAALQRQVQAEHKRDALALEVEALNERIAEMDGKIRDLQDQVQRISRAKEQTDSKLLNAQNTSEEHRLNAEECQRTLDELQLTLEHQRNRYEKLQQDSRGSKSDLQNQLGDAETEVSQLKAEREKLKAELTKLTANEVELQNTLTDLQHERDSMETDLQRQCAEKTRLTHGNRSLQEEVDKLEHQVTDLKAQIGDLQREVQKAELLNVQITEITNETTTLEQILHKTKDERDKLQTELRPLQQDHAHLKAQLETTTADKKHLEAELKVAQEQLLSGSTDKAKLAEKLKEADEQRQKFQQDIQELEIKKKGVMRELSADREDLLRQITEAETEIRHLKNERDHLQTENVEVTSENKTLKDALNAEDNAKADLLRDQAEAEALLTETRTRLETVEAELETAKSEAEKVAVAEKELRLQYELQRTDNDTLLGTIQQQNQLSEQLSQSRDKAQDETLTLHEKIRELTEALDQAHNDLDLEREQHHSGEIELKELRVRLESHDLMNEQLRLVQDEVELEKQHRTRAEQRIRGFEIEKMKLKEEMDQYAKQMQMFASSDEEAESLRQRLENERKSSTARQAELNELNAKILQLQRDLSKTREEHNRNLDEMLQSFEKKTQAKNKRETDLLTQLEATQTEIRQYTEVISSVMKTLTYALTSTGEDYSQSNLSQLSEALHNLCLRAMQERDQANELVDKLRDAYNMLSQELEGIKEKNRGPLETVVDETVTVERHGSRTRADLLRRIGEGYKMIEKCKQHLRQSKASENQLKRRAAGPAKEVLIALDTNRADVEKIREVFEDVIRNYFTPDEKKTQGFSVEFLKTDHKPLPLRADTITTRTTIRGGHSPTPDSGRLSPGRAEATSPVPSSTLPSPTVSQRGASPALPLATATSIGSTSMNPQLSPSASPSYVPHNLQRHPPTSRSMSSAPVDIPPLPLHNFPHDPTMNVALLSASSAATSCYTTTTTTIETARSEETIDAWVPPSQRREPALNFYKELARTSPRRQPLTHGLTPTMAPPSPHATSPRITPRFSPPSPHRQPPMMMVPMVPMSAPPHVATTGWVGTVAEEDYLRRRSF